MKLRNNPYLHTIATDFREVWFVSWAVSASLKWVIYQVNKMSPAYVTPETMQWDLGNLQRFNLGWRLSYDNGYQLDFINHVLVGSILQNALTWNNAGAKHSSVVIRWNISLKNPSRWHHHSHHSTEKTGLQYSVLLNYSTITGWIEISSFNALLN